MNWPHHHHGGPHLSKARHFVITIATNPAHSRHGMPPTGRVTVDLRGELDMDSVASIEPTLAALTRAGLDELRLDLGALAFCDTSGINLFLRLHHRCARTRTVLVLTGVRAQPARVIRLVRLHHTIACRFADTTSARRRTPRIAGVAEPSRVDIRGGHSTLIIPGPAPRPTRSPSPRPVTASDPTG
jgi:anti-sigma B factor antagonist